MPPPRPPATSILLNPPESPEPQRTYVILGTRRGGTSMVAGVARALGLDLGNLGQRMNNEDVRFQNQHVDRLRETVAQRNEEQDVWGWKFPGAGGYLPDIWASLRNPYFVIVYRDPVAAALSQSRFDRPKARRTDRLSLHESNANSNLNTSLAMSVDRPCLLVSHERALAEPGTLIDEMASFLMVPQVSSELRSRILEYVRPGQYKKFDEVFGDQGPTAAPADQPPAQDSKRLRRFFGALGSRTP